MTACGFSQQMRIGILTDYQLKKIKFNNSIGNYHVMADSIYLGLASSNDIIEIKAENSKTINTNLQNEIREVRGFMIISFALCISLCGGLLTRD